MRATTAAVLAAAACALELGHVPARLSNGPYTAMLVVPTGIGAAIGGYAGDALPVARALASVADRVVTHPNVMNGAQMYWPDNSLQYVEGYALDEFAAGRWGLRPATSQRVGLLLDCAIEPELTLRHLQAADASRATLGVDVCAHAITDEPVGVELALSPSGASWGTVRSPGTLVRGAQRLVAAGATAIAVVARFPDEDEEMLANYRAGAGVDAVAGAEAIISHLITKELRLPCAHAPACAPLPAEPDLSPRACAEELGHTFLPCVLVNLSRAPSLIADASAPRRPGDIWADDVDAIVVPASACGGAAVLSLLDADGVLVIAVEENASAMDVPAAKLGNGVAERVVVVRSYAEAIGLMAAHKAGVQPASLTPRTTSIRATRV